jgi:hypothetical protein
LKDKRAKRAAGSAVLTAIAIACARVLADEKSAPCRGFAVDPASFFAVQWAGYRAGIAPS